PPHLARQSSRSPSLDLDLGADRPDSDFDTHETGCSTSTILSFTAGTVVLPPMSPALASYPSLSLPPPVAADPRRYQSQYPECSSSKSAFRSVSSGSTEWSVPFRVGLPTPPSEMTGVTYNTTLSSSMYGGKQYGVPVQQYAKAPTQAPVNSVSTNTSTTAHQNYVPPPEKEAPAAASETKSQKKNTNDSIAPYLQIPSSINNSKGSLAEFAAQVRIPVTRACQSGNPLTLVSI
ncbi:Mucin, partial [Rasamsonia emersonii CBS 393.64]